MVSLQQPTSGVTQVIALAEIDPGPPVLTPHELAYSLRTSSPQMTESTIAPKARCALISSQRPAEQQLAPLDNQATGIEWDGKLATGTNGPHQEINEAEGGITFEYPRYSCPSAMGSPCATPLEETFGASRHLGTHLSGMSVKCLRGQLPGPYAIGKGSDEKRTPRQAGSQTSPDMLPPPARGNMTTRPIDEATRIGRSDHVLPRTFRSVELLRRSYDAAVIDSWRGGDLATACTSRAGENTCAPQGGRRECSYGHTKRTKQVPRKPSMEPALHDLGGTVGEGNPTDEMYRGFGKGQHASLRNG